MTGRIKKCVLIRNYAASLKKRHFIRKLIRFVAYFLIIWTIVLNSLLIYYGWQREKRVNQTLNIIRFPWNTNDISCYTGTNHKSPRSKFDGSSKSNKRIFFHEISCKGGLDSRQACAIESAARANPGWDIEVLFLGSLKNDFLKSKVYQLMNATKNVRFSRIDLIKHFDQTPMKKDIVQELNSVRNSKFYERVSEILRYITLYKYAGVYLDLDVVVVQSFVELTNNWIAKQSATEIGAGAFRFSSDRLGRKIANAAISAIMKSPKYSDSDDILKEALKKICTTQNITKMTAKTCQGLEVYEKVYFYPVDWKHLRNYRRPEVLSLIDTFTAYAHHMWNAEDTESILSQKSRYVKLAKRFCPGVYGIFEENFGI